ncbi:hypothetical protein TUM17382_34130 [Shewanella algae]|nr:hypothetical protein TUM17382_34130 [Shewanella algae]
MKRLFISLYLLISLSFLGLGWTLDALWQQHDDEAELLADAPLMAMAAMLKPMPPEQRQQAITAANVNATYPLRLFSADKITLADDGELAPGEVFTTLTNSGKQMQFIRLDQQVLMTGPIDTDPRAQSARSVHPVLLSISGRGCPGLGLAAVTGSQSAETSHPGTWSGQMGYPYQAVAPLSSKTPGAHLQ